MRGNMNMEDPAAQEQVRRGPHEYVTGDGRHGIYKPKPYVHQEYPKMMGTLPRPSFEEFRGKPDAQALYDAAVKTWDAWMTASVVKNKAEENAWLKANPA